MSITLHKKFSYCELFWSVFSRIQTEYSARVREDIDQNNSEYGHFSRSVRHQFDIQQCYMNILCTFDFIHVFTESIVFTAQKMKFYIKDFFSKCDQIRSFGHIYWRNPSWKTSFFVECLSHELQHLIFQFSEKNFAWKIIFWFIFRWVLRGL